MVSIIYNQVKAPNESILSSRECLSTESHKVLDVKYIHLLIKKHCSAAASFINAKMGRFLDCDKMYWYGS